ncbi:hypothetical protein B0H14DRAFT_2650663 [Mycena olivaceomarginata]|nr:hypothetical protein B0H14DRAFT_2650663 [Mycena olivaceomarginata]
MDNGSKARPKAVAHFPKNSANISLQLHKGCCSSLNRLPYNFHPVNTIRKVHEFYSPLSTHQHCKALYTCRVVLPAWLAPDVPASPRFFLPGALGPHPAFGALSHLTNPYAHDAPGDVYFLRRNSRKVRRRYKRGKISRSSYLAASEVKAGHSKEFERPASVQKCEKDWKLRWKFRVYTPSRMLIVRPNAEGPRPRGVWQMQGTCSPMFASGGVGGMVDSAVSWMKLFGGKSQWLNEIEISL